jgi:hexosaminidase
MATTRLFTLFVVVAHVAALWPLPQNIQTGTTPLLLAPDFNIDVNLDGPPSDLLDAVSRTKSYLQKDKLERLVVGRGSADEQAIAGAKSLPSLSLSLENNATANAIADEAVMDFTDRNEAYVLNVPEDGSPAELTANTTLGLFRGLTTFSQLWYSCNGTMYTLETPVNITDWPSYVSVF